MIFSDTPVKPVDVDLGNNMVNDKYYKLLLFIKY